MRKTLYYLLLPLCLYVTPHINAEAQYIFPGFNIGDTTTFTFSTMDSLYHILDPMFPIEMVPTYYTIDTTNMGLWEIGNTAKPFFIDSAETIRGIMTDTLHNYPANANSSFILKIAPVANNVYFSFRHKYQTRAGHDGGIVEISADNGITWDNVMGDCNGDSILSTPAVVTDSFYGRYDTLTSGEPAFSGTSSGWVTSKFQFFYGFPLRLSGGGPSCINDTEMLVRFRFKSDSIPDSLPGWIISSIKVEVDLYEGVPTVNKLKTLKVFPNPSIDGVFHFPVLDDEGKYSMEIFNAVGDKIYTGSYKHDIDLSKFANGLYFYKVRNGAEYYRGQLIIR